MKKIYYSFLMAALALGSCSQEEFVNQETSMDEYSLFASIESNKRSIIIEGESAENAQWNVGWMTKDNMKVFCQDFTENVIFDYSGEDQALEGTFTPQNKPTKPSRYAFYPAGRYKKNKDGNKIILDLGSTYKAAEYAYRMATVGNVEGNSVSMKHLTSIIKVNLKNVPAESGRVKLLSDKPVTGQFELVFDANGVTTSLVAVKDSVKNRIDANYSGYSGEIYIPILPGMQTLSFQLLTADGKNGVSKTLTAPVKEYKRGSVYEYNLNFMEYPYLVAVAPVSTEVWLQQWNASKEDQQFPLKNAEGWYKRTSPTVKTPTTCSVADNVLTISAAAKKQGSWNNDIVFFHSKASYDLAEYKLELDIKGGAANSVLGICISNSKDNRLFKILTSANDNRSVTTLTYGGKDLSQWETKTVKFNFAEITERGSSNGKYKDGKDAEGKDIFKAIPYTPATAADVKDGINIMLYNYSNLANSTVSIKNIKISKLVK